MGSVLKVRAGLIWFRWPLVRRLTTPTFARASRTGFRQSQSRGSATRDLTYYVQFHLFKSEPPLLEVRQKKRGRGCLVRCAVLVAYPQPKFILCHEGGCVQTGSEGAGLSTETSDLSHLARYSVPPKDLGRLTLTPANPSIAVPRVRLDDRRVRLKVLRGGDSLSHLLAPHVPMRSDCQRRVCPALKCPTGLTYIRLVPKGSERRIRRQPIHEPTPLV